MKTSPATSLAPKPDIDARKRKADPASGASKGPAPDAGRLALSLSKHKILAAAKEVFARLGFSATRVEDLLQGAGVARRTFYKHYRSKEEVLAGLYEMATDELVFAIEAAGAQDPMAGIRFGIGLYLDYHTSNSALLKVLLEQSMRSDSPLAPLRRSFRARLAKLIARAVEERGGSYDRLLFVALIGALESLSLDLLQEGSPSVAQVETAKRVILTLIARAVEASA